MCGRYLIISNPEAIRRLFGYKDLPNFPARYNVAPTQPVPIVRRVESERCFALVRWGLIPAWAKDPKKFTLLINARGESVNEKASFRNAMKRRRCLFPADGFYEWKQDGARKRAYCIRPKGGGPVAFAGLWETWSGPNGEEIETAAIVTTQANATLNDIHHRMPAVLAPDVFDAWLDCNATDAQAAANMIGPAPEDLFEAHEVSSAVNSIVNDSAALLAPLDPDDIAEPEPVKKRVRKNPVDEKQGSLF